MKQKIAIFIVVLSWLLLIAGAVFAQTEADVLKDTIDARITDIVAPKTIKASTLGQTMKEVVDYAEGVADGKADTADLLELATKSQFNRGIDNNKEWYQATYSAYTFNNISNSFNNDTAIDGVTVEQFGNYLYALQGWRASMYGLPTVLPYVFKWHVNDLAAPPVKSFAPWLGRHACPTYVQNGKLTIMGSDAQLLPTIQKDAWAATSDDTGKLTWVQTNASCAGCTMFFMEGALNPADSGFYYGGGQKAANYTSGTSDTLWVTFDNGATSQYVGKFACLAGNIIGCLQFFEDNKLHVIAGGLYHQTSGLRTYKKTHYVIDVVNKTQTQLEDYPGEAVHYITTTVADGKIWTYGGANAGGNHDDVYTYDANGVWTKITNSTLPQTHAAGLGGYTDTNGVKHLAKIAGNFTDDVWRIDIEQGFAKQNQDVSFENITASANVMADTFKAIAAAINTIIPESGTSVTTKATSINELGVEWVGDVSNGYVITSAGAAYNQVQSTASDGATAKPLAIRNKVSINRNNTPRAQLEVRPSATRDTLLREDLTLNQSGQYISHENLSSNGGTNWALRAYYDANTPTAAIGYSGNYLGFGFYFDCYPDGSGGIIGSRTTSDMMQCFRQEYPDGFCLYTNPTTTSGTNYFNNTYRKWLITNTGKMGFQLATPTAANVTAYLHIGAGTATAGTSPLKFTSGTLNTTPEAGAVEFYNSKWYFTPTNGTRKRIVFINEDGTLPEYTDNAAALSGGLTAGELYRDGDTIKIVH